MECLFCDFLSGKKEHSNNFPFLPIFSSEKTISFLSIPEKQHLEKSHILIIPKKHYESLSEIPQETLSDLISHTSLACQALKKELKFPGARVQLNEGKEAGQYIPHTHFHIYPMKNKEKEDLPGLEEFNIKNFKEASKSLAEKFKKLATSYKQ